MKAVGLFSGGLDSILAIKLVQNQGIDVIAVAFRSPFFIASEEKKKKLEKIAKREGFKIHFIEFGTDYLNLVRKPKHGHGKNINPCIDCHAFMIKKATAYAKKIGAKFLFTGEVLDERPMSQNRKSLDIVAEESGLSGKLLRPLSAKLLPETEAEKKGWIDREKLTGIRGRGRKPQFRLAKEFKIDKFETPGGGCLLTFEVYANKLKDLFKNKKKISWDEVILLKSGRHFRHKDNKIIVGRHKADNEQLKKLKKKSDIMLEAKGVMGPVTLLQGKAGKKIIELAARFTARYADATGNKIIVKYGKEKMNKEMIVDQVSEKEIEEYRII
jgi:tRNA U34 2-thiouridine synthase MnmA/TrmU